MRGFLAPRSLVPDRLLDGVSIEVVRLCDQVDRVDGVELLVQHLGADPVDRRDPEGVVKVDDDRRTGAARPVAAGDVVLELDLVEEGCGRGIEDALTTATDDEAQPLIDPCLGLELVDLAHWALTPQRHDDTVTHLSRLKSNASRGRRTTSDLTLNRGICREWAAGDQGDDNPRCRAHAVTASARTGTSRSRVFHRAE